MIKEIKKEIQLEKEQLERELSWLLNEELPNIIEFLKLGLKDFLNEKFLNLENIDCNQLELSLAHPQNSNIKGTLNVKDDKIFQMDLIAQMNIFNQKHLFQIKLNNNRYYKLSQITQVKYLLRELYISLYNINKVSSKEDAYQVIQNWIRLFDKIQINLNTPPIQSLFPNKVVDSQIITPTLPQDLTIQFYIKNEVILLELLHLITHTPSSKNKTSSTLLSKSKLLNNSNKSIFLINQKQVQIVDYFSLSIPHPGLIHLLKWIKTSKEVLFKFIKLLQTFD